MDINEAIREVIELTRGEAVKNGVSVRTHLADGLPLIHGDRVQLQQVNLNLIINAVEAMGGVRDGPRELLISTVQAEPGGVLVAVRDSGPGLAPAALERLVRGLLHDQAERIGAGAVDLPVDHRSARRPIVGERECAPRGHLSLHGPGPTVQCRATGDTALAVWRNPARGNNDVNIMVMQAILPPGGVA